MRQRRLAGLLGGELHIADRTDGVRGAAFRLTLPLRTPAPDTVDLVAQAAASPARAATLLRDGRSGIIMKRNVLVVDDSEGNRRILRRMLQQLGCRVIEAGDGDEVLAALAAAVTVDGRGVDVVLMDIEMARVDGLAALAGMRAAGWTMPVITTTGYASAEDAASCTSAIRALVWCPKYVTHTDTHTQTHTHTHTHAHTHTHTHTRR